MSDHTEMDVRDPDSSALQAPADLRPLANRSMFWRPVYLAPSAWTEHVPFAFWLIESHRPRVFVELGTHYGTSYFGFCQAVDRLNLDTRCFAVDTWKGDEHAGEYDEGVFEQVDAHNEAHYSGFSRLVRSTFDEALEHFTDATVDLLHIDGLHTLEAVTHDFESWLPKLSRRAIVVFHDINVRERGFGVFKLFEQLAERYPVFEFVHGHGLGVVAVGPDAAEDESLKQLFQANADPARQRAVREVFSRLGHACADAQKVDNALEQARRARAARAELADVRGELEVRRAELADVRARLEATADKYATERGQWVERMARESEHAARQAEHAAHEVKRRETRIEELSNELRSVEARMHDREEELSNELRSQAMRMHDRDEEISTLRADLDRRVQLEAERSAQVHALGEKVGEQNRELVHLRAECERMAPLEARLNDAEKVLTLRRGEFAALGEQLRRREKELETLRGEFAERIEAQKRRSDVRIHELESAVKQYEQRLARGEEDLAGREQELRTNAQRITELELQLEATQRELEQLSHSRSWRLTAPLRWALRRGGPATDAGGADSSHAPDEKALADGIQHDHVELLRESRFFDAGWYLEHNPDVAASGVDPIRHYLANGAGEGRDPSPDFSTRSYLERYPDVGESGTNPLVHFLSFGQSEGRIPGNDGPGTPMGAARQAEGN